jgi:hypothetical protein
MTPVPGVERQDVDRAPFSPDVERHFDLHEPVQRTECSSDFFNESRVIGVEQPVEPFSVPGQVQLEASRQGGGNRIHGPDGYLFGVAELDAGHHRS